MDEQSRDPLPIGRVAFAKAFCSDWVAANQKVVVAALGTLVVLVFCLFQLTGRFSAKHKSDYFELNKAFSAWLSDESHSPKILRSLERPLREHPEVEAKFGTHIAQRMLALGDVKRADRYGSAALHRARNMTSSYYERFSRNTLAISKGQFEVALAEALRFKQELELDDLFWEGKDKFIRSGTVLYAYNLMRIAALQRQIGSKEGELKAWQELIKNAGWKESPVYSKTYDPEAYSLLAQNFSQGDVSLLEYIEQRCKELHY
jgi:hypothetical protein